jgi:hypothetical protein
MQIRIQWVQSFSDSKRTFRHRANLDALVSTRGDSTRINVLRTGCSCPARMVPLLH